MNHLALLPEPDLYVLPRIGGAAEQYGLVALHDHAVAVYDGQLQAAVVAREGRIDGAGQDMCALGIGMQGIGKRSGREWSGE